MVILGNFILSILLAALPPPHTVRVNVELKQSTLSEQRPIEGELTVQHEKEQEVNLKSAELNGKPLALEFVKEVKTPQGLKTTYSFKLEGKAGGLHVLKPISIEVGGAKVKSTQLSYQVLGPTSQTGAPSSAILKLEPLIEGRKLFYPRQKAVFGYRYFFNENIELKEEKLPLLEPPGFKRVGDLDVQNFRRGDIGVREMRQKVEAVTPGKYAIGPSLVQGLPYQLTLFQTKEYSDNPVQATAPGMEIEIRAFPEKGRPASFNGAIGQDLKFRAVLQSFSDVFVGDKITISLEISGEGEIENAPPPDLCCQPGFPGKFRQSDIPPAEIIKNGIKYVVIDLFPLSAYIKEIPSIEFSFFDPDTETYKAVKSDPIPIRVRPTSEALFDVKDAEAIEKQKAAPTQTDWPELNAKPQKIDIATIYPLTPEDLHSRFLGTLSSLWILLFGPLAIFIQKDMKKRLARRQERAVTGGKTAIDPWSEIDQLPDDSSLLASKISKVLLEEMKAQGLIDRSDLSINELPDTGAASEVKQFLSQLEEERFSKMKKIDPATLRKVGKELFEKIRKEGGK